MIKSAAIIKNKTLAPWRELRLQKRKLKKEQAIERKQMKQIRPSPIGTVQFVEVPEFVEVSEVVDEIAKPTRDEMLEQADKISLKVDKRWSDETLLNRINQAMEAESWDTASASS
jgi:hypothetical protein